MELLYTIFLLPIETIMKLILELCYKFTNNYGLSIIFLSVIINLALIPVYNMALKWRDKDKEKRDSMKSMLDKIKQNYKGKERYFYTQALYKIHNYSPISSVKASAGFLIQIPFFFAAFSLLANYEPLQGVGFLILQDLSKPDGLFFGLNLLPFVMTVVNLLAAYVYINKYDKNEKYQLWGIAILFLVLLYTQASALLLYWTFNNIFALVKSLVEKNFKIEKPKFLFLRLNVDNINTVYFIQVLIAIVISFLIPLHILNHSENGWENFNIDIFLASSLTYTIFFIFLQVVLILFLYFIKLKKTILPIMMFILTWIVLAGFVFPIAESRGMVEANEVEINLIKLFIVLVGSCIILLFGIIKNYKLPIFFNITIILFSIIDIGLGSIDDTSENNLEIVQNFETISDKNIIILSFDGIPSFVFKNVIYDNPQFKEVFKDFIYFTEAFSTAPATYASTRSSLFGNRNFRKDGDKGENIDLKDELIQLPINKIENSYTYSAIHKKFKTNKEKTFPVYYYSKKIQSAVFVTESLYLIHISYSRVLSSKFIEFLNKIKVENFLRNIIFFVLPNNEIDSIFKNYKNYKWKIPYVLNKYDFENILNNLNVDYNKENYISLREMHFSHTHFPVDFDQNCMLKSTSKSWVDDNQNYQGLYNQTVCATKQFINFIEKLKRLGVYENSLIVIKSDHGEPATYFDDAPNSYIINQNATWGYNRYKPLLMVKDFSQKQEDLKEDSSFVGLPDIAKTICIKSGLDNCNHFKGVNLFSKNIKEEISKNPYIYIDVVIDEKSDFKSESQKTIKIDRSKYSNILEAFKDHDGVSLSEPNINNFPQENGLYEIRQKDLINIKTALEKYYKDNENYPKSKGFDGVYTNWGESRVDWIQGLAPKYIENLPSDPRNTDDPTLQYLYLSDGKDYKLISHNPEDCEKVKIENKNFIDPQRDCWAYGFWTNDSKKW